MRIYFTNTTNLYLPSGSVLFGLMNVKTLVPCYDPPIVEATRGIFYGEN